MSSFNDNITVQGLGLSPVPVVGSAQAGSRVPLASDCSIVGVDSLAPTMPHATGNQMDAIDRCASELGEFIAGHPNVHKEIKSISLRLLVAVKEARAATTVAVPQPAVQTRSASAQTRKTTGRATTESGVEGKLDLILRRIELLESGRAPPNVVPPVRSAPQKGPRKEKKREPTVTAVSTAAPKVKKKKRKKKKEKKSEEPKKAKEPVKPTRRWNEIVMAVPPPRMPEGVKGPVNSTYSAVAHIMKKVMLTSDSSEVPTGTIRAVRCSPRGEIILRLNSAASMETVARAVSDAAPEVEIRSRIPTVRVRIRDIHPGIERSEVHGALAKALGLSDLSKIGVGGLRPSYGGTRTCSAEVPWTATSRGLIRRGRVNIGLTPCRVGVSGDRARCFRCWEGGHVARNCRGPDRSGLCRKCCKEGHKAANCKERPFCAPCKAPHRFGTKSCGRSK
jgi:hypothetical protein